MIFVMSIALGISFLGFYISFGAAQNWINTHVYTKEYLYEIEQQKLKQLERYIEKEGIKLKNIEKISTWQKENKNISLNIFSEDVLIYDSWNDYKYNAGYTYADLIRIGYDSKKKNRVSRRKSYCIYDVHQQSCFRKYGKCIFIGNMVCDIYIICNCNYE